MKICFSCKHKCVALKKLDEGELPEEMYHAKKNIYVKCLKGKNMKIIDLFKNYSHMPVGSLDHMRFNCFELSEGSY